MSCSFRARALPIAVRVVLGSMWLYNVAWKRPTDFGRSSDSGLFHFASYAVNDPVIPPFSWMVEWLVLPNIEIFGWAVLIVETVIAVMLLTGIWVTGAACLGAAQSLMIALCVAFAPNEWPWAYWLMITAHLSLLAMPAARFFSVDGVTLGITSAKRLAAVWGSTAVLVGLVAATTAGAGSVRLGSTALSLSVGTYTLFTACWLLAAGAVLLGSIWLDRRIAGWSCAAISVAGAVVTHIFALTGPRWAAGDATSAAVLLGVGVVAIAVARRAPKSPTWSGAPSTCQ